MSSKMMLNHAIKDNSIPSIKKVFIKAQKAGKQQQLLSSLDEQGRTALHIAIKYHDDRELIKCLLEYGIDANQVDNNGQTPFHYALKKNRAIASRALVLSTAPIITRDNNGISSLDTAIACNEHRLIELLFSCYDDVVRLHDKDAPDALYQTLYRMAIENDNLLLFYKLARYQSANFATLPAAKEKISKLLQYKPGPNYICYQEQMQKKPYDPDLMTRIYLDFTDSSSDEDSDSEDDEFELIRDIPDHFEVDDLFHRGVHFTPTHFSGNLRQQARLSINHDVPIRSLATLKLEEAGKSFETADALIKAYFELLALTHDKPELKADYKIRNRVKDTFDNLYHRFVHTYVNVNGYKELFNQGGMSRNFNFFSDENPLISLTPQANVAICYATGERIATDKRYYPKVRRSTGTLKHRRLGYLEVYAIEGDYLERYSIDIDGLKNNGKISISHNQSFNQETVIQSSIPREAIVAFQVISLPNFVNDWHEGMLDQYGLNEQKYESIKSDLLDNYENRVSILSKLIHDVTKHQVQLFMEQIRYHKAISSDLKTDIDSETECENSNSL